MVGIFFGRFQRFFVNCCSAVSCDSGVLVRRGEYTSSYSTILSRAEMQEPRNQPRNQELVLLRVGQTKLELTNF